MIVTRHEVRVGAVIVAWLGAVAVGFAAWERYDATPGEAAPGARAQAAEPATGRWSLVMFAHPRCECTRASLSELRELIARNSAAVDVRVLFVRPKGVEAGWERGDLWASASEIPGARVECDADGVAARRAGATVSGHVLLHGPDGRLAFAGGITKARGRLGEGAGRRAILAHLRGEAGGDRAPTFGCALFTPRDCCNPEGN